MIEYLEVDGQPRVRVWCDDCGTLIFYGYDSRCAACRRDRAMARTVYYLAAALICLAVAMLLQA